MKRIFFFYLIASFSLHASAQEEVVTWITGFNSNTSEIEITANLAPGWHIFSQYLEGGIGPVPTQIVFEENASISFIGRMTEPVSVNQFDANFESMLHFFENEVKFTQKVNTTQTTILKGTITYMACNEFECIPPLDQIITIKITR